MATKGLSIPVRPGRNGGAAIDSGTDQLLKIITAALAGGDDENPFQDLGMPEDMIFANDDPGTRGLARQRVRRVLGKFSDRVALDPKTNISVIKGTAGEMRALFRVIDLETDDPLDFDVRLG